MDELANITTPGPIFGLKGLEPVQFFGRCCQRNLQGNWPVVQMLIWSRRYVVPLLLE